MHISNQEFDVTYTFEAQFPVVREVSDSILVGFGSQGNFWSLIQTTTNLGTIWHRTMTMANGKKTRWGCDGWLSYSGEAEPSGPCT